MKSIFKILGLVAIDFLLIWSAVNYIDPEPSVSIGIILVVPFVFALNLITSGALFLLKKRHYGKLFLINAFVSSFIMFYLYNNKIDQYQNARLESWEFINADTTFRLTRWKIENEFSFSYSTIPGSSMEFLTGECKTEKGIFVLTTDTSRYIIKDNYLIGFRNKDARIRIEKVER